MISGKEGLEKQGWRRELDPPKKCKLWLGYWASPEQSPVLILACPVAWYKREFLALPVTAAGMTSMQVTAGLGTPGAQLHWGSQGQAHYTKACQRAHSPTGFPPYHGPGSRPGPCQAFGAQGEEGLSVLCLCLGGDCQAVGRCPPNYSWNSHSFNTLVGTPAGTHYGGECLLGKAVRSQPRPGCGSWHLRAPYSPRQNWLKEFC